MVKISHIVRLGGDPQLARLAEQHGADACRLYLEELRWPGGAECPRCESRDLLWLERRRRHQCRMCRYQFRVTAGTVFHDSHISLDCWFLAIALMLVSERGMPATQLNAILGGSYKSAWFLEHRIRAAMAHRGAESGALVAYARAAPTAASGPALEHGAAPPGWWLLRSLIAGDHRGVGGKYLGAYWDEVRWRARHRANPNAFRDTVLALLRHPWLPYDELTGRSLSRRTNDH